MALVLPFFISNRAVYMELDPSTGQTCHWNSVLRRPRPSKLLPQLLPVSKLPLLFHVILISMAVVVVAVEAVVVVVVVVVAVVMVAVAVDVAVDVAAVAILHHPMHLQTFLARCGILTWLMFHNSRLILLMDVGIMGPMGGILIPIAVTYKHGQPIMVLILQTQLPLLDNPLLHLFQLLLFPTNGGLPVKLQHLPSMLYMFLP